MSTKPPARPNGFWKQEAETLRRIAPSMTMQQLMERYQTTRIRMLQTLNQLGIDFADKQKGTFTKAQGQELAKLATTHTPRQLSEHFDVPIHRVHGYLARHKIKAVPGKAEALWHTRRKELERIAPTMTLSALQAHYRQQGHEHSIGAIRQALVGLQIKWQRTKQQSELYGRKDELAQLATHMTSTQIAAQLGYSRNYMWKVLHEMGITPQQPAKAAKAPASKPVKPSKPPKAAKAAKPTQGPKLVKPAEHMDAATPSRASIASRKPAQIIWPDHVKVQHIRLPKPPANAPICSGTMRAPYVPSQDWYRSPRAI